MARQIEAFAYGDITNGGIVIGGENAAQSYSLIGWDLDEASFTRIAFSADFWIHGRGATDALRRVDYQANLLALQEAATRGSGNLAITAGDERSMTVDIVTAGQTVTITITAGDNFVVAEDVGMPINIDGIGALQLATVTSTTIATAVVPASQTAPATTAGLTARMGYNHFSLEDGTPNRLGFLGRATLTKSPNDEDEKFRRKYALAITFERPGADVRDATKAQRRRAKYAVRIGESELTEITFSGEYTSGGDADAVANYIANITVWIDEVLATFTGKTFDKVGADLYDTDDERGILTFQAQRKQLNFPEGDGVLDDPAIRGAQVSFSRSINMVHGLRGATQPYQVSVTYDASIDVTEKTYDEIYALWQTQIKPYLVKQVSSIFGQAVVILNESAPAVDVVNNRISASLVTLISSSGSNVYSYRRSNSYELTENAEIDQIYDGRSNSAVVWFPGHLVFGSVNIEVATLGRPKSGTNRSGGARAGRFSGLPGIGVFGIGGRLGISIGSGKKSEGADASFIEFPQPADPNNVLGNDVGFGTWIALGRTARISPVIWGEDPDKAGSSIEVTFASYSQRFVWLQEAIINADELAPAPPRPTTGGTAKQKSIPRNSTPSGT